MTALNTQDVFSGVALPYIGEYGCKAGIPEYLRNECTGFSDHIISGVHVPWSEISQSRIKTILSEKYASGEPVLARSTHPDDGVGYEGRLRTHEININHDIYSFYSAYMLFRREKSSLENYAKRLEYAGVENTGLYLQKKIEGKGVKFGSILEHPHLPGIYIISGSEGPYHFKQEIWIDKKNNEKSPHHFRNRDQNKEITYAKPLLELFEKVIGTGVLAEHIAGEMEYAILPDGKIFILQLRAFKEKKVAEWEMDIKDAFGPTQSTVFGITDENGIEISISDLDVYKQKSAKHGSEDQEEELGKGVLKNDTKMKFPPDFPLEQMQLVVSAASNSILEHGCIEAASLSRVSCFLHSARVDTMFPYLGEDDHCNVLLRSDGKHVSFEVAS